MRRDEDDRQLSFRGGQLALKLETAFPGNLMSTTRHVGPSGCGSASKNSETDENCRVSSPTVRNSRPTKSRNSGSSSMIKTLGWVSDIPVPWRATPLSPTISFILAAIVPQEQAPFDRSGRRLTKPAAGDISHGLRGVALLCRQPELKLRGVAQARAVRGVPERATAGKLQCRNLD